MIERYTRVSKDQIDYEATIEDPKVLTRPWTIRTTMMLREGTRVQEYVCAENNQDPGAIRAAAEGGRRLPSLMWRGSGPEDQGMAFELTVNGTPHRVDADPQTLAACG